MTPSGYYGRPHLHFMPGVRSWRCRDNQGNRGYGQTKEEAYNRWVDSVQFNRLASGYRAPAPLTKAALK